MKNPFRQLTRFELFLWSISMLISIVSFFFSDAQSPVSLAASLIGVTALIFVAKGYVIGQILMVIFAVLYGIVSYELKYYGEMITYLGMSAPIAIISAITWFKNPYKGTKEVKVAPLTPKKLSVLLILTTAVTFIFYFILKALGNASLIVSTISVATSFFAASLTILRSPYYAIGYSLNDVVLIILWTIATLSDISKLPMLACFIVFFANDIYGFISWKRMQHRQKE